MKRLVLSFAILLAAACGSGGETGSGDVDRAKPGKPRGKPQLDPGIDDGGAASADAGGASDSGSAASDASPGQDSATGRPDSGVPDSATAPDGSAVNPDGSTGASTAFDGAWNVTLDANENTTCTRPGSFSPQIIDTWQIQGDTLTGNHLGPNAFEREPGSDVWSSGAASIDLVLNGAVLGGTVYFEYSCGDVFYDVTGERAR